MPDFLTDETTDVAKEECLAVFGDSTNPEKMILEVVNCTEQSLVFFTADRTEQTTNIGIPVLPCLPQSESTQLNDTKRRKRSNGE